jgi:hypothetical protein
MSGTLVFSTRKPLSISHSPNSLLFTWPSFCLDNRDELVANNTRDAYCSAILSDGSDSLTLTYPGSDNLLVTEKGDFNDRVLSYQCFKAEAFELDPEVEDDDNAKMD